MCAWREERGNSIGKQLYPHRKNIDLVKRIVPIAKKVNGRNKIASIGKNLIWGENIIMSLT
jgi:hypothetical protein